MLRGVLIFLLTIPLASAAVSAELSDALKGKWGLEGACGQTSADGQDDFFFLTSSTLAWGSDASCEIVQALQSRDSEADWFLSMLCNDGGIRYPANASLFILDNSTAEITLDGMLGLNSWDPGRLERATVTEPLERCGE